MLVIRLIQLYWKLTCAVFEFVCVDLSLVFGVLNCVFFCFSFLERF